MNKTEAEFFAEWDEASWNFTIMDEEEPSQPVLQGGLVATFRIGDSSGKRTAMTKILRRYAGLFGEHLTWASWTGDSSFNLRPDMATSLKRSADAFQSSNPLGHAAVNWSSSDGKDHVGSWSIECFAFSQLAEVNWTPRPIGKLRFYLPIDYLKGDGRVALENFVRETASELKPLNAVVGIGLQQCYEFHRYENLEFELSSEFSGFEFGNTLGGEWASEGIKSVNWYTILDNQFVVKLGGRDELAAKLDAAGLGLIDYDGGVMVKAGDWPSLGWRERDPKPAPYVLANHILKPVRAANIGGMHTGSIAGEARMTPALSNEWARRFDVPDTELPPSLPKPPVVVAPVFAVTGEPCPRSGLWSPRADVPIPDQHVAQGAPMPMAEWRDKKSTLQQRAIRWQWVKAAD